MPPPIPQTEDENQAALDQVIAFSLHGKQYVFRPSDVCSRDELDYRRATGFGYQEILTDAVGTPQLQMFMWLARRQAGERELPYDALTDVTYADLAAVEWPEEQEDPHAGEAPAAG